MSEQSSKKNQLVVVGAVFFVVIVLAVMFLSSFGKKDRAAPSALPQVVNSGVRDTSAMTPQYEQNLHDYNARRAQEAQAKGTTALPVLTPTSEPQEDRKVRDAPPVQHRNEYAKVDNGQPNQNMLKQMTNLLELWSPPESKSEYTEIRKDRDRQLASAPAQSSVASKNQGEARRVVDAGLMIPGVTDALIHTDDKMPAFVSAAGGDLNGAKFVCKVSRRDEAVAVLCNRMTWRGKTYKANAAVLDIATSRGVLTGSVDRKMMERYGWPFLAAMVGGYGRLISAPDTTSITIGTAGVTSTSNKASSSDILLGGVGAGAEAVARELTKSKSTEIAVSIPEKTPVAIYIFDAIVDDGTEAPPLMFDSSNTQSQPVFQAPLAPVLPIQIGNPSNQSGVGVQ